MNITTSRYRLLTATGAASVALALGAAGAANAAPLELGNTPAVTAPAATDIAIGTGSLNPGSIGSGSATGGSSNPYAPYTGSGKGTGSSGWGDKIGRMGPNIAAGIDNFLRGLGFRPGNVPAAPDAEPPAAEG
ncbi:hypothetical protein ACFVUS_35620 [Nocardia sp. NPDC058058]|uniref:hypothetical protein n=1 Tax=Nocardia sp. NPDC058058 TaxID=3346317 RepID=UPI0036DA962B